MSDLRKPFPTSELVYEPRRTRQGEWYWAPIDEPSPTLAAALWRFFAALLGLVGRVVGRVFAVAFLVAYWLAVFFAALLVFAVLFSLV